MGQGSYCCRGRIDETDQKEINPLENNYCNKFKEGSTFSNDLVSEKRKVFEDILSNDNEKIIDLKKQKNYDNKERSIEEVKDENEGFEDRNDNLEYSIKKENIDDKNNEKKNKHNPPYWNEKSFENLESEVYEISDEKTNQIFELFNNIRLYPQKYINQTNDESISNILIKANNSPNKPNALLYNNNFYYQFREGLMNIYATPGADDDIVNNTIETFFKEFKNKNYYFVECPLEKEEDAVWNLIKKYENIAVEELLTKIINYCIICPMPIKDSYDMRIHFLMLNE